MEKLKRAWYEDNIYLVYLWKMIGSILLPLRFGWIFDHYVLAVGGTLKTLGYFSLINVVASIISAPLAIKVHEMIPGRQLMNLCFILGLLILLLKYIAYSYDSLLFMGAILVVNKLWYETSTIFLEVVFASAIPKTQRTTIFIQRKLFSTLWSCISPLITILMVSFGSNNNWTPTALRRLVISGLIISVFQVSLLRLVQVDDKACKNESAKPNAFNWLEIQSWSMLLELQKPLLLTCASQFTFAFANGMTSRYLNEFVKHFADLSPRKLAVIHFIQTLVYLLLSLIVKKLLEKKSRVDRRLQALFVFSLVGFLSTMGIISCKLVGEYHNSLPLNANNRDARVVVFEPPSNTYYHKAPHDGPRRELTFTPTLSTFVQWSGTKANNTLLCFLLILYILRNVFATLGSPLLPAFILDYAPIHSRAGWLSMDSLVIPVWSLGAVFGGLLSFSTESIYLLFFCSGLCFVIASTLINQTCSLCTRRNDEISDKE